MGTRINTIMQTCFFAISGVLPRDEAIARIKHTIEKTYAKRGAEVVQRNYEAVDTALAHLQQVAVPAMPIASYRVPPLPPPEVPDFVKQVTTVMLANHGDRLPVSAFPIDGTWPVGTAKWEKRNLASEIPVWDQGLCIQCNKCALVCPHAAIRVKVYRPDLLAGAPDTFKSVSYKGPDLTGATRCRLRRRTAPGACCAWPYARRRTRRRPTARPWRWRRRCRSATWNVAITSSSSSCPKQIGRGSATT